MSRVLLVIPTLGTRPELLQQSVASIRDQAVAADIAIVSPPSALISDLANTPGITWIADPNEGLAAAINRGVNEAVRDHAFVSWLGDDDLLTPRSLSLTTSALDSDPDAVLAYGPCRYIDGHGRDLWTNQAPSWVVPVLSWGPQLVPQPGMLVRYQAWRAVNGLNETYTMAFDFDLLLRLKKLGHFIRVPQPVSCFRWHADSLTVDDRTKNLLESERAKRAALSPRLRPWAWTWEPPVRWATRFAASRVQRRAQRLGSGGQP